MIRRAVFLFLMGVLCVSTALAATERDVQPSVVYRPGPEGLQHKLDGKTAGASFHTALAGTTGGQVNFNIDPTQLPDGSRGYYADIYWAEDGSNFHEIYGLLPASAVTFTGLSRPLQVNITEQSFYVVPGSPFGDDGDFISLEGAFTPYTGLGSYTVGQSGKNYQTETHLDGSTETFTFNGTSKSETATFEGTLVVSSGTYDLSVQGPCPSASMIFRVGTQTDIITTP